MKLYLSSYRIPTADDVKTLFGKPLAKVSLALIPNAKDYYADRARNVKIADTINDLETVGFKYIQVLDLREIADKSASPTIFENFDAVFMAGGNTFCLMHEVERSGLQSILPGLIANGLLYIGESAGAVIAGPTLKGTELADNPEFSERILWDGLGLVQKAILPHADNATYAVGIGAAEKMLEVDHEVILLNDNQAYVVDGESTRIVTRN